MAKFHVLQLGPYPPPEGGVTRNMVAIRDEMLAQGNRCSIIATSQSSRIGDEPDVYHPQSAFKLIKLLMSLDYDILHMHIGGDITKRLLSLAFACSLFGRKRSILTLHSGAYPLTDAAKHASSKSVRGRIFRLFSHIIAVNEPIANVFYRYGLTSERVSVIPPYALEMPDEHINVPDELADFAKQRSPLLLAVGGLEKDYDPLFQIAALERVLATSPNAGLMIIGDGSMRSELDALISACGYGDKIHLAGNVAHAVTLHLINEADVMLRTTLFDGDAISIREAIYLGTPVIATDNGMRPNGVHLIRIGDEVGLIDAVNMIASNGHRKVERLPRDTSNIQAVLDLYRHCLSGS